MGTQWEQTALLVVDVQQAQFAKSTPVFEEKELINNINALMSKARSAKVPVIVIQHCNDSFLKKGTEGWKPHSSLTVSKEDIYLEKTNSSAFKEPDLHKLLQSKNIKKIVITGLVTHGCIKAACLDGLKLGYETVLVKDGHSNFNKDAAELIGEWNKKLGEAGARLMAAKEIDFSA